MDPALHGTRTLKKEHSTPTRDTDNNFSQKEKIYKKKAKPPASSSGPKLDGLDYKTMTGSSQYKFGVLAKIVKHMKSRHQEGDDHPLTLEEILMKPTS
ncbi:hypothetical protein L9F63_027994 [Diploptera punctata]|uniref:Uncharacterized protein n=1 Tax=Diploptera punctata TaxID=6984 RepID=A0AAD7ZYQ5_DIPPU|nr:hypothetical protein L9F63_027994 [Diploptera punctata]